MIPVGFPKVVIAVLVAALVPRHGPGVALRVWRGRAGRVVQLCVVSGNMVVVMAEGVVVSATVWLGMAFATP
jgi:hypothetical protein